MVPVPDDAPTDRSLRPSRLILICFVAATGLGVGLVSHYALLSTVIEGMRALVILVPPALAGLWLVPLLRLGTMPFRWHLLLGAMLGLGTISLLVLCLGLAGVLARGVGIALLGVLAIVGLVRLRQVCTSEQTTGLATDARAPDALHYLWLVACPFLCLALLAASNAPGFIWAEEGFGYDVLEYHLQLPKEYYQAGVIAYAPHNVYGNFPAGVEMFYLLAMVVFDDVRDIGVTANMIHLMLGVLVVFAAWVAGREFSRRTGLIAAVVTASAGWLCYLSGLAYVENGMLFFGFAASACLLRVAKPAGECHTNDAATSATFDSGHRTGWIVAVGLAAGFACGCKYTAVPMIVLPVTLAFMLRRRRTLPRRVTDGLIVVVAALVAFSPWLIKNQVMTGNAVFPLANGIFQASPPGWGEEQTRQWDAGHSLKPEEASFGGRLELLWRHVINDRYSRFGPALFLLALGGLIGRRRDRVDLILGVMILAQLGVWLLATHLYARFAVVLLIPVGLMAGRALRGNDGLTRVWMVGVVLVLGALWNFYQAAKLNRTESPNGAPASLIYDGELSAYEYFKVVNHELPEGAKILLLGDAKAFYFQRKVDYCVVFNINPFVEVVRSAPDDEAVVTCLREQGYTHVLVNWTEIDRLSRTYGFTSAITPEYFARLEQHNLILARRFPHPQREELYVDLYRID